MSIVHAARRLSSRTTRPATIRKTPATFGAGILPAEVPTVETPADDWGVRFDAAQRRYRERNRKLSVEIETRPVVTPAEAVQGFGLDLAETFLINEARNAASCIAVLRTHPDTPAEVLAPLQDAASKAAALEAATIILEAAPRTLLPRKPLTGVRTPVATEDNREEGDASADDGTSFADELIEAVHQTETVPTDGNASVPSRSSPKPNAPSPVDQAWLLGFELGRDGIDARPNHATHAEVMAFLAGHDQGMAEYRDEEREALEATIAAMEADHDPFDDLHDGELMEARMVRPVMA